MSEVIRLAKDEKRELVFEDVYQEYYNRIYRFVSFRLDPSEDIEDMVSTIFLKVYEKLDTFSLEKGALSTWVFTIASNTLKDHYRRRSILSFFSMEKEELVEDKKPTPEIFMEKKEELAFLKSLVRKLPKTDQQIISLKYGAELKHEEIGEILRLSPNNVGVRHYRILQKLKKEMEKYDEGK